MGADVGAFISAAGRSLADAQAELAGDRLPQTVVALSEATLDAKVAMTRGGDGALVVEPISLADTAAGKIEAAALSSIRVSFVAVADTGLDAGAALPARSEEDVIREIAERADVKRLNGIFGGLGFEAVFVPRARRWLVRATVGDVLVREEIVADEVTGHG